MTGVQNLKNDKRIQQKVKDTYQLKMSNRIGVDDGCTKLTIGWFDRVDGSALIVNSLWKVKNER